MLKFLSLTENLSHIPRVQKPGLRPMALAFPYPRPGQKPAQAKGQGPAWPSFWPQAKAGTSLLFFLFFFVFFFLSKQPQFGSLKERFTRLFLSIT